MIWESLGVEKSVGMWGEVRRDVGKCERTFSHLPSPPAKPQHTFPHLPLHVPTPFSTHLHPHPNTLPHTLHTHPIHSPTPLFTHPTSSLTFPRDGHLSAIVIGDNFLLIIVIAQNSLDLSITVIAFVIYFVIADKLSR